MTIKCLEERVPYSNSHKDTLWATRERLGGCPCLLGVCPLTNGDLCLPWASCLWACSFQPLPWSSLCRQLPNPRLLHPVGQSSAEMIRRSILIKSLRVMGTLCFRLNSRTYQEPAVPFGLLRQIWGVTQMWIRETHGLIEWKPLWGDKTSEENVQQSTTSGFAGVLSVLSLPYLRSERDSDLFGERNQ